MASTFQKLLVERQSMDQIWGQTLGQDIWGIGQIGAPFTWAPLLADMACSVFDGDLA